MVCRQGSRRAAVPLQTLVDDDLRGFDLSMADWGTAAATTQNWCGAVRAVA
jgi:hypothetical protein